MTTPTFSSYRWCDSQGQWHHGYPPSQSTYTAIHGCDSRGNWKNCTPPQLDGTVEGTAGNDIIDIAYTGDPQGDRVDRNDAILPGAAPNDDLIYGYGGNDLIKAGLGNDKVYGGSGNDTIFGEAGNDVIYGGKGDDSIDGGEGNDILYGDAGNDILIGGRGNDTVYGGDGNDRIDTRNTVNPLPDKGYPGLYPADADAYNDRDVVYGGAGDDRIYTGDDKDTIFGGTGNDYIDAGIDDDSIDGGDGNDTIIGGEGNDVINGGAGDDVIYGGLDMSFPDAINIPDDAGDLRPDNGMDTIFGGAGNDIIFGMDDDDTIYGGTGTDVIDGGVDDDVIYGDDGDDTLTGGQGNDLIYGGFGSDRIIGGNGGDDVVGGEDPDGSDVDVLDLTGSDVDKIVYLVRPDGTTDSEAGTVHFTDGTTMTFSEIENVIPCFTPGTMIATPKGERLVEELVEGDRIITRDNGIQDIAWVGHKVMSGEALKASTHLRPVLIKAGSLGNGLPERDMMVSPNHRMLVASDLTQLYFDEREVLAAAKHLVGSAGVDTAKVSATTYIHFMFERHEVVLANGAWTESFQPGDYSLKGLGNAQRNEIFELFPNLKSQVGLLGYQSARKSLKKHEARLLVR